MLNVSFVCQSLSTELKGLESKQRNKHYREFILWLMTLLVCLLAPFKIVCLNKCSMGMFLFHFPENCFTFVIKHPWYLVRFVGWQKMKLLCPDWSPGASETRALFAVAVSGFMSSHYPPLFSSSCCHPPFFCSGLSFLFFVSPLISSLVSVNVWFVS